MGNGGVSEKYIEYREQVLNYKNTDMNLKLENDEQVYIAVFDVPVESAIIGANTQTFALVFGLNMHMYFGNGQVITGLEENMQVMKAMQSLLISAHQVLSKMHITNNTDFYQSKNVRAYLKTRKGIFFKEIIGDCKEDKFLLMLFNNLRKEIVNIL